MKKYSYNKLLSVMYPILIVLIVFLIMKSNYVAGTILSGWDTLHPEFNIALYLKRAFYGVWQEHQGVGVPPSQAHAAELPRLVIIYLLDLVLPVFQIRYAFYFLTLLSGALGMFYLLKKVLKFEGVSSLSASFLGALFYLFNLTVVQQYFVPLEMFAVHFATLPWLFLFIVSYLKEGRGKHLFWFFVVSVLSTAMAHTPTLFYIYFASLVVFLSCYSLIAKKKKITKRTLAIVLITVGVNLFWILPNFYYLSKNSSNVQDSRIHSNFTDEAYLQSKSFGTVSDLALGKNFLFNWKVNDFEKGEFTDLLGVWKIHFEKPYVSFIGYLLFITSIFGLVMSLLKRSIIGMSLFPLLLVCVFFLINSNPPFTFLYEFLRSNISLLQEGLRFPFTKFSILFQFILSFFFAYAIAQLFGLIKDKRTGNILKGMTILSVSLVMIYYMLPMFKGYLISPSMKVNIPSEYFELFDSLNEKDHSSRIAKLPLHSYWGWNYHKWGYEGAGFTWFGIPQATLDREFDRWSPYNESFYNEASSALYQEDLEGFEDVLAKYDVGYLILDESVINPSGLGDSLFTSEIRKLLSESKNITKEETFGFLTLYNTNLSSNDKYIRELSDYVLVEADLTYSPYDPIYSSYGDYVSGLTTYPFVNFDERRGVQFSVKNSEVSIYYEFEEPVNGGEIILPGFEDEKYIAVEVYAERKDENLLKLTFVSSHPDVVINNGQVVNGNSFTQVHEVSFGTTFPESIEVESEIYKLNGLEAGGDEVRLGITTFPTDEEVEIKFYKDFKDEGFYEEIALEEPRLCSDPDKKQELVSDAFGFRLDVGNEPICLGKYLESTTDSLYKFSFEAKSDSGVVPQICISQDDKQVCLDRYIHKSYKGEKGGWSSYSFTVPVNEGGYWIDFVASNPDEDSVSSIYYRNIEVEKADVVKKLSYEVGGVNSKMIKEKVIDVSDDISSIKLVFPQVESANQMFEYKNDNARNCDPMDLGEVGKNVVDRSVVYEAYNNAVACDHFYYPQLSYDKGYLLKLKGENIKGRSFKIYIFDSKTTKSIIEKVLGSGNFDEYYVLHPREDEGEGYTLSLETRAFGEVSSKNKLSQVEISEIPIAWLNKVVVTPKDTSFGEIMVDNGGIKKLSSDLKVSSVRKIGNIAYEISDVKGSGILQLSQGYDTGWIAYIGTYSTFKPLLLPFMDRLDHVKVNGWSNGWDIESGMCNGCTVTVVYIPQYLQYFGLLILAVLSFGLIYYKKSEKKQFK